MREIRFTSSKRTRAYVLVMAGPMALANILGIYIIVGPARSDLPMAALVMPVPILCVSVAAIFLHFRMAVFSDGDRLIIRNFSSRTVEVRRSDILDFRVGRGPRHSRRQMFVVPQTGNLVRVDVVTAGGTLWLDRELEQLGEFRAWLEA